MQGDTSGGTTAQRRIAKGKALNTITTNGMSVKAARHRYTPVYTAKLTPNAGERTARMLLVGMSNNASFWEKCGGFLKI